MNNDMANTHGDLLVQRVHKNNSLDHLMRGTASRPGSAAVKRPGSAASSGRPRSRASRPQSAAQDSRPVLSRKSSRAASAQPSYRSSLEKTDLQKKIDGDTGPAMIGVSTYPYSVAQKLYKDDFEQMVASTITHPYIAGTSFNVNSAPHDLLEGSALKNVDRGNIHKWVSTYKRDYVPKDVKEAFNAKAVGLRSEQAVFVG